MRVIIESGYVKLDVIKAGEIVQKNGWVRSDKGSMYAVYSDGREEEMKIILDPAELPLVVMETVLRASMDDVSLTEKCFHPPDPEWVENHHGKEEQAMERTIIKKGIIHDLPGILVCDPLNYDNAKAGYRRIDLPKGDYDFICRIEGSPSGSFTDTSMVVVIRRHLGEGLEDTDILGITKDSGCIVHDASLFPNPERFNIYVDSASVYVGKDIALDDISYVRADEICVRTAADGLYGPVTEYNVEQEPVTEYNVEQETKLCLLNGKEITVPAGFYGVTIELSYFDGTGPDELLSLLIAHFGVEGIEGATTNENASQEPCCKGKHKVIITERHQNFYETIVLEVSSIESFETVARMVKSKPEFDALAATSDVRWCESFEEVADLSCDENAMVYCFGTRDHAQGYRKLDVINHQYTPVEDCLVYPSTSTGAAAKENVSARLTRDVNTATTCSKLR